MDISFDQANFVVPHVLQQNSFDCGLACVCMVLRGLGLFGINLWELNKKVAVTSIWTIDLVRRYFLYF